MSRRGVYRGGRGGRRGGMVAGQSVVQDAQNDMYCSGMQSPYPGEFYPDSHYYIPGGPPDMPQMCTVHGDYGENNQLILILISIIDKPFIHTI